VEHRKHSWTNGSSTHVFVICGLTLAFGWIGNCVKKPALAFIRNFHHDFEVVYFGKRFETRFAFPSLDPRSWYWNSEWLAYKWGEGPSDEEFERTGCDMFIYRGWLGQHVW
jgi:hypothetical protein